MNHLKEMRNIISGTVAGESPDCLLLSGTVVGENPDHVCWVSINKVKIALDFLHGQPFNDFVKNIFNEQKLFETNMYMMYSDTSCTWAMEMVIEKMFAFFLDRIDFSFSNQSLFIFPQKLNDHRIIYTTADVYIYQSTVPTLW